MKLNVTFKQQDHEFDQAYANEYNGGKESDGNWKFVLNETYPFGEIESYSIYDNTEYELSFKNEKAISTFKISGVQIVNIKLATGISYKIVVSKELCNKPKIAVNEKYQFTRIYFYFKNNMKYMQFGDFVFVLESDLPLELKKKLSKNGI